LGNLESVDNELAAIQKVKGLDVRALLNEEATTIAVFEELKNHNWVHFSCHGLVNPLEPLSSYFKLEGGPLDVQDIIQARISNAEFAYLAACHSAAPGSLMPDENIHLAAALQFCGYGSIVGTMWEMFDNDGPLIAGLFYQKLMALGGKQKYSAEALRYAIRRCKRRGLGLERWSMFVHIGM
jgi:CHAT domain-containing protein